MGSIKLNSEEFPGAGGYYGYRASKVALNAISKSLSIDHKKDSVGLLMFHPGYVATAINGNAAGAISPEQSVTAMAKVIGDASLADSGKFLDYQGETMPW